MTRPTLLLWCQHSVGMGHLVRSLTLAGALARRFHVVLLSGGTFPDELAVPAGVRVVPLPPIGHEADYTLVSRVPGVSVEEAQSRRVERVLAELHACAPDVLMIELYPFGRRKFAFELLPLLDAARSLPRPPLVVCSVRDILVASRRDQARHDEQAAQVANRYLDAVLVHADERFARLEESFQPATPLAVPVVYTGFVRREPTPGTAAGTPTGTAAGPDAPPDGARPARLPRVLVSAGGGLVGEPLFAVAAEAAPAVLAEHGLTTTVVTGPFLPDDARAALDRARSRMPDCLEVVGFVDDLAGEIARSTVSVSQCGYNTTMDLLSAGTPAVVVPYAEGREDEQTRRARRLADLGAVLVVEATALTPRSLVEAVGRARTSGTTGSTVGGTAGGTVGSTVGSTGLRLDGADRTVEAVTGLLSSRRAGSRAASR